MTRTTAETPDLDELRRADGLDLNAIEARAMAATPGPWAFEELGGREPDGCGYIRPQDKDGKEIAHHGDMGRPRQVNLSNAAHIVGLDPSTALALVAEVRRLTEQVAAMLDRLAKAEAERDDAFVKGLQEAANIARRKARDDGKLWVLGEATASDSELCAVTGCAIAERIEARAAALVADGAGASKEISLNAGSANELDPTGRPKEITSGAALVAGQEATR